MPTSHDAYGPNARGSRALTQEELEDFLTAVPERWKFFFQFLAHTGLRFGEAAALRWGRDVSLQEFPHLTIRCRWDITEKRSVPLLSKHASRVIPLSPGMVRCLARRQGEPGAPVLLTEPGAGLSYAALYRRIIFPAREATGLNFVGLYSFRYTCASLLLHAGRNMQEVDAWLGRSGHAPSQANPHRAYRADGLDFLDAAVPLDD